jgi:hypothetical protein
VGCATIISIAVNEPGCNLSITEAHNDVTIPNGSDGAIDVSIAGAFGLVQFVWNDGNTMKTEIIWPAGTYTLTVNDAGNCVALITVNIAQPTCILALTQNHTDVTTPNV